MPGRKGTERGQSVPTPTWWVTEARKRLAPIGGPKVTLKELAQRLQSEGYDITETMVIRCLHEDPKRRIGTLEAIEAISTYLDMPSCVFIAENMSQALAIRGALVQFEADVDQLKISAGVADRHTRRHPHPVDTEHESSGRQKAGNAGSMGKRGARAAAVRPGPIRRTTRAR